LLNFNFLLLFWVWLHCGIYNSSYNVSNIWYSNLPPPPISFASHHHWWNNFNRDHFSFYIPVYTIFAHIYPPSPFPLPLPLLLVPTPSSPGRICSALPFSDFVEEGGEGE
jgi:hypothetical protein